LHLIAACEAAARALRRHLFTLGGSIRHDLKAFEDAAFVLTIAWPSTEQLAAMKHRGYGS
jgi:hypothetical protein